MNNDNKLNRHNFSTFVGTYMEVFKLNPRQVARAMKCPEGVIHRTVLLGRSWPTKALIDEAQRMLRNDFADYEQISWAKTEQDQCGPRALGTGGGAAVGGGAVWGLVGGGSASEIAVALAWLGNLIFPGGGMALGVLAAGGIMLAGAAGGYAVASGCGYYGSEMHLSSHAYDIDYHWETPKEDYQPSA